MGSVLLIFLLFFGFIFCVVKGIQGSKNRVSGQNTPPPAPQKTIRCPWCGGQARVQGSSWVCPWCGDGGQLSQRRK